MSVCDDKKDCVLVMNILIGLRYNEIKETNGHISDFHHLNES